MVYEYIVAGDFDIELDHGCASGRDEGGLHVGERRTGERGLVVHPVEDFADHVEGRGEVGSADTEEDANAFTDIGFERLLIFEGVDRTIEDEVFRLFAK